MRGFGDETEVGVVAEGEAAFVGEAEAFGDVAGEEGSGGEVVIEEEREGVLDAGDAAPHGKEVIAVFEIGRGGGVVGAEGIDFASEEFLAEGVEGGLGAEGWGAFGKGADANGVGVGKEEVVGAGFDGDVDALFFGGVDEVDAFGVGDVDDVEGAAGFAGEFESEGDGVEFELDGAGGEPGGHVVTGGAGGGIEFGVDGDGEVEGGSFFHAGSEGGGTGVDEFVETGGAHEGFEADGASVGEGFEMVE